MLRRACHGGVFYASLHRTLLELHTHQCHVTTSTESRASYAVGQRAALMAPGVARGPPGRQAGCVIHQYWSYFFVAVGNKPVFTFCFRPADGGIPLPNILHQGYTKAARRLDTGNIGNNDVAGAGIV